MEVAKTAVNVCNTSTWEAEAIKLSSMLTQTTSQDPKIKMSKIKYIMHVGEGRET